MKFWLYAVATLRLFLVLLHFYFSLSLPILCFCPTLCLLVETTQPLHLFFGESKCQLLHFVITSLAYRNWRCFHFVQSFCLCTGSLKRANYHYNVIQSLYSLDLGLQFC